MSQVIDMFQTDSPAIAAYFGVGGILAQAIPGFLPRAEQEKLAQRTYSTLDGNRWLVAECGTGTGKSIGLLVPAIEWALKKRRLVVISTGTKALQGQYSSLDLPRLERVLGPHLIAKHGRNFRWSVLKGFGNYLCRESFKELLAADQSDQRSAELGEFVTEVSEWESKTDTGDLNEMPRELLSNQKALLTTNDCPGRENCPSGFTCYGYHAKDVSQGVDILVINHAILALHLLQGNQLPYFGAAIIDEAHQLERYVRSALEQIVSGQRLRAINSLAKAYAPALLTRWLEASAFFGQLIQRNVRVNEKSDVHVQFEEADRFRNLCKVLEELDVAFRSRGLDQGDFDIQRAMADFQGVAKAITSIEDEHEAVWVEWEERGQRELHVAPVSVGSFLRERLWRRFPGVLASATLTAKRGDFTFFKDSMGMPSASLEMVADSPFQWHRNALYIIPDTIPESAVTSRRGEGRADATARWVTAIWPEIKRNILANGGQAFVLCTSMEVARRLAQRHGPFGDNLSLPAQVQGSMSKDALVAWFKATTNAVLYATDSFWEGVDVPGDALSMVIIDKIPFSGPSDPIETAKLAALTVELGSTRSAFFALQIPQAIYKLKQAAGRLLRTETDRGVVVLLDPRFRTKAYGTQLLQALPGDACAALRRKSVDLAAFKAGYHPDSRPAQGPVEEAARDALRAAELTPLDTPDQCALVYQLRQVGTLLDKDWAAAVKLSSRWRR